MTRGAMALKQMMVVLILICFPFYNIHSWAGEKGRMIGGGVGSVPCSDFIATLAHANSIGGLHSIPGANAINVYWGYILGFQTGYNVANPIAGDIFESFGGAKVSDKVLYSVEAQCKQNPEQHFGEALVSFARSIH